MIVYLLEFGISTSVDHIVTMQVLESKRDFSGVEAGVFIIQALHLAQVVKKLSTGDVFL